MLGALPFRVLYRVWPVKDATFLLTLTFNLNAIRSTAYPTILATDLKYLTIKVRRPYFIYVYYIAGKESISPLI